MYRQYRLAGRHSEVARLFGASLSDGVSGSEDVLPSCAGLVTSGNVAQMMTWGFPHILQGAKGQRLKPTAIGTVRHGKLRTATWLSSFEERRCLIPMTAWEEAGDEEGGHKSYSFPDGAVFAVAGIWGHTQEWGRCFAIVTVASSEQGGRHMPLILATDDWALWVAGSTVDALALCQPWPGELAKKLSSGTSI